MGLLKVLVMAAMGALNPALVLGADLLDFIVAEDDDRYSGLRFVVNLGSMGIPGGIAKDLVVGAATEVFLPGQMEGAARQIAPRNELSVPCHRCGRWSPYYVQRESRIICRDCLGEDLRRQAQNGAVAYVLGTNVRSIHARLQLAYTMDELPLSEHPLDEEALDAGTLDDGALDQPPLSEWPT